MFPQDATSLPFRRPIFAVDDDESDRLLLDRLARSAEIQQPCQVFARGDDLIDALIEVMRGAPPPLLCLVDINMPGMSGFDVLRWIRCQHAFDDLPVVMLTSSDRPHDLQEAHHAGAQCYVAKFPSPAHFRAIVTEAERVAAFSAVEPFKVPCNLLLGAAAPSLAVAASVSEWTGNPLAHARGHAT